MRALESAALVTSVSTAAPDNPAQSATPRDHATKPPVDPPVPPADSSSDFKPPCPAARDPQQTSLPSFHTLEQHVKQLDQHLDAMFQLQQARSETDDLDEPLFFQSHRRGRSLDAAVRYHGKQQSSTSDVLDNETRRAKQRPASSSMPAQAWAGELSQLALAPRGSTARQASSVRYDAAQSASAGPAARDAAGNGLDACSETIGRRLPPPAPPRSRSASADGQLSSTKGSAPSRLSRSSPGSLFRRSLRPPFLPSIPASPLPPLVSPGLTRSASSPPVLPAITTGAPLAPSFFLLPPTASLSPSASWPRDDSSNDSTTARTSPPPLVYRPSTSASAPNLPLFATAPASEASSYFSSPAHTAASSPTAATVPLPLAGAFSLTPSSSDGPLEHDPELLVADAAAEVAEANERADAAQLDERRYHALVELVETERGYLEHLRVLVKVYFQTLPFLTALTVAEVQAVVRNAEELLALHERIGQRIEQVQRELQWCAEDAERDEHDERAFQTRKAAGYIARIFADEMPNFELYNEFCARHAEALDITRSVASRPEWEAFERQCAARVAIDGGRGDRTPVASASPPGFFPPLSAASAGSPLPFSATPLTTPSHSSGSVPTLASLTPSAASSSAITKGRGSRLRFVDYAIAPVQRVTRYPLVLAQLAKYFTGTHEHAAISSTWASFKAVAQGVDAAKREHEGEMRTKVVASRMEFSTPLLGGTFCDILGPTLLVGALHVVHSGAALAIPQAATSTSSGQQQQAEVMKVRYLGCFLYRSHLVMAKIKKRASYEPKEWLPLRLFDIQGIDDGSGLLSHSIRLTYRDHQFELGALCEGERSVWLSHLLAAQSEARRVWATQELDEHGKPTLFDDSVVSSVATDARIAQRKSHSRSASSVSVVSTFGGSNHGHPPTSTNSPVLAQEEPVPAVPSEFIEIAKTSPGSADAAADVTAAAVLSTSAPLSPMSSPPSHTLSLTTPTLVSRSRFSSTASSLLLGRTPASQRAAVDLRLADVFSQECLSARAQAAREVELERAASLANRRNRTMSGPKRSMTALTPGSTFTSAASPPSASFKVPPGQSAAGGIRERRRMSSAEVGLALADRAEFRGAIGFDAMQAALYHQSKAPGLGLAGLTATTPEKERGRSWASAIRKAGHKAGSQGSTGSSSLSRPRPALPDIDTALAERAGKRGSMPPLSAGASWSRRTGRERERDRDGGLGGQLRRVASHSSVDVHPTAPPSSLPTMLVLPGTPTATSTHAQAETSSAGACALIGNAADVERNNSVSSTASSSGTGTNSSSSHAYGMQVVDTPPSSIPPSPDFGTVELAEALNAQPSMGLKPTLAAVREAPVHTSPRWSSASDGMSNMFRLRRRKSTLGLVPPVFPSRTSLSASDDSLASPTLQPAESAAVSYQHVPRPTSSAIKLQRRASTTISGLFSSKKRTQSSPSLAGTAGYFSGASVSSSTHLPLSRSSTNSSSPTSSTTGGTPAQVPTTPDLTVHRPLPAVAVQASAKAPVSSSGSATPTSPVKRSDSSNHKGSMLLRSRTRFRFASYNGMTPLS